MKRLTTWLWVLICAGLVTAATGSVALANKPPWAGGGGGGPHDPPPVSAPEPLTLTLIGMGASGLVGYFLGKRKR
jgi:hypothetical protein